MQGHGLVVCNIAPAFAFAVEQLGVEAPGDDGVDDDVVGAVEVMLFGNGEELALTVA
jgi:hypothetical protein